MVRLMKIALSLGILTVPLLAQTPEQRIQALEERLQKIESRVWDTVSMDNLLAFQRALDARHDADEHPFLGYASSGMLLLTIGCLCALWAQNTGRNPWLWFLLGSLLNVMTLFSVLMRNSEDRMKARIRDAARIKGAA